MKKYSVAIALFFQIVTFSSCIILTVPVPNNPSPNPNPPTNNPTNPPTNPTTDSEKKTDTNNNTSTFYDPDNLKVTFKKEDTDAYKNTFVGKVRAQAKTTPSDAKSRYYNSVGDVLATLPTDNYMRTIGVNDRSPRTKDENINVFIRKAYLFYISEEEDGDFHLFIGDLIDGEKKNLMTAEISGLPADKTSRAYMLLERTRRQLYEQYPDFFISNKKTFRPRTNFPEISIRGSLFFDTHHSVGQVGSGSEKPQTVWEIHPVTYIKFLSNKDK